MHLAAIDRSIFLHEARHRVRIETVEHPRVDGTMANLAPRQPSDDTATGAAVVESDVPACPSVNNGQPCKRNFAQRIIGPERAIPKAD